MALRSGQKATLWRPMAQNARESEDGDRHNRIRGGQEFRFTEESKAGLRDGQTVRATPAAFSRSLFEALCAMH